MKYYIIAGEASGDLHASNLMKALKVEDANAQFRCWGGERMQSAGGELVKHYRDLAFMGFLEVAANITTILNNISYCKADILQYQPDVVILVDYPGFNLRIAKFLKEKGIRNFYYISPQVWAWHSSRVRSIKKIVDKMFVILPFERDFYQEWDYDVDFVGHPLLDAIDRRENNTSFRLQNNLSDKPIIALLPGSRKQEIKRMLPVMVIMQKHFTDYQMVVAGLSMHGERFYGQYIDAGDVSVVYDQTYDLLEHAHIALVTSGTATLETALFEVPQVVCYSGNPISYIIGKWLVNVEYISLVNLIMKKEVVKELIQADFNETRLKKAIENILDEDAMRGMIFQYKALKEHLGGVGASTRAAKLMVEYLNQ